MSDPEERIRALAHDLWVADGMPGGKEEEHWFRASDIVRRQDFEATMDPNPAVEAEDYEGLVNPDPASRQTDEPPDQRAVADLEAERQAMKAARARKRVIGGSQPPVRPATYRAAAVDWHGLLS